MALHAQPTSFLLRARAERAEVKTGCMTRVFAKERYRPEAFELCGVKKIEH